MKFFQISNKFDIASDKPEETKQLINQELLTIKNVDKERFSNIDFTDLISRQVRRQVARLIFMWIFFRFVISTRSVMQIP